MEKTIHRNIWTKEHRILIPLARGIGWGLIGGFAGTLTMDLILIGVLSAVGLPALTCFSIVGNTVARFFSILGIKMMGGVPLGMATHYVIGPIIGGTFGVLVTQFNIFRAKTLKKSIVLAALYVEILSQPILALTPILLKMTANETLQWFGGALVMHLICGIVLGVIVSHGLKLIIDCKS
jgi:hypothetical protein